MKQICGILVVIVALSPLSVSAADRDVFLNAFGETATAYLNDSFLLLCTIADAFAADIMPKETARDNARNVQKRVRIIRAKLMAVAGSPLAEVDRKLVELLDRAYACLDHQAWALTQYVGEKSPEKARRFEEHRINCQHRLRRIAEFYSALPPSPELPEPLSTR